MPTLDHLQGPQARIPKTAAEAAGEIRGAGGSAAGTAVETAGGTALALRSRETTVPPPVCGSSPSTPPTTLNFPGSFRSSLCSSFGESGLGGPVDGRGNGFPNMGFWVAMLLVGRLGALCPT